MSSDQAITKGIKTFQNQSPVLWVDIFIVMELGASSITVFNGAELAVDDRRTASFQPQEILWLSAKWSVTVTYL